MKRQFLSILFVLLTASCGTSTPSKQKEYVKYTVDFEQFNLGTNKMYQSQEAGFDDTLLTYFQQATDNLTTSFISTKDNRVKIEESDFVEDHQNVKGLIIGSANYDGQIDLSFSKKLHTVSIEIEQYYNIYYGYDFGQKQVQIHYDCQEYDETLEEYVGFSTITVNDSRWKGTGETYVYNETYTEMIIEIPNKNTAYFEIDNNNLTLKGLASERCRIYKMTLEFEK